MSTPPKRTRVSGPKVRSGCITCKVRHVKCDEGKPACNRCTSTGRTCDGYPQAASKDIALRPLAVRGATCVVTKKPYHDPVLLKSISMSISTDQVELRGFQFFLQRTGNELMSKLNSPTINLNCMLQFSHSFAAVKHSSIALGLMGERLQISNVCTSKNPQANASHLDAQAQYQKALVELRLLLQKDDDTSLWSALTTCMLLVCVEFLQGNAAGTLTHLEMGFRVLNMWRARSPPPRAELKPDDSLTVLEGMTHLFGLLDAQASMWLKSRHVWPEVGPEWLLLNRKPPTGKEFVSIAEAEDDLDAIKMNLQFFLRAKSAVATEADVEWNKQVMKRQDQLVHDLDQWPRALDLYLQSRGAGLTLREVNYSSSLLANHHVTTLLFAAIFEDDEEAYYRNLRDDFATLIANIKPLLEPVNFMLEPETRKMMTYHYHPDKDPMPTFSFCPGLIEALYFVAVRCDDLEICKEAVRLLVTEPWREGGWDSAVMAKLALNQIRARSRISKLPGLMSVEGLLAELSV